MRRYIFPVLLIAAFLAACGPDATPSPFSSSVQPTKTPASSAVTRTARTLTIFAAASLTEAFTELAHNFEANHPGVTVTLNFAGSQTLSTQLTQGAMADIFASANLAEMDKLVANGLVLLNTPRNFLTNKLVIALPKNNPANVQTLQELARPGLKLVLAADSVPAGKYTRQILDNISKDPTYGPDYKTKVLSNVASNENDVRLVLAKVQLGEADAGIVYASDAIAGHELKVIEIPAAFNVVADYPIARLARAQEPELASEFITYVLSADGQANLKKWGFTPITP